MKSFQNNFIRYIFFAPFLATLFKVGRLFTTYLAVANLVCLIFCLLLGQLGPGIYSGSGVQVVTQSTHLVKE